MKHISTRTQPRRQPATRRSGAIAFVVVALAALVPGAASAQATAFFDPEEGLNSIALGVATVSDYMGSNHEKAAAAPLLRYYFSGKRYAQVLGPQLSANLINDDVFQLGPQVLVRFKRDSSVHDAVVQRMTPVDTAVEGGIFAAATWKLGSDPRHTIGVRGDVQGGKHGTEGTLGFNYFFPVARPLILNINGGTGFANGKWARTYFGVSGSDVALFPSLGGNAFNPGGGVKGNRLGFGAVLSFSPQWFVAAGARYERLAGDFGRSPIVAERGDKNQWIYGAALGFLWQ